jgi:hypothetical protein
MSFQDICNGKKPDLLYWWSKHTPMDLRRVRIFIGGCLVVQAVTTCNEPASVGKFASDQAPGLVCAIYNPNSSRIQPVRQLHATRRAG